MQNNFLMGMKFDTSWGVTTRIIKITLLERVFEKIVSNLSILEGVFEAKFQGWFFLLRRNFKRDFFCKIEGEFSFLWKWRKVKLKGISFKMAFYPRASLARTVFSFKTFFDPRYRPPTPVLVKVKWSEKSEIHFWSFKFFRFQICWGGGLG